MRWAKLDDDRVLVAMSGLGTAIFVACYAAAIALYPGGTWWNPASVGHSFTRNFLCDLMQTVALNGEPTPVGSWLARIGMFAMLVALAAFYTQIANLETPESKAGALARRAGWVSCAFGITIPIVTSDMWRLGHLISVVASFLPSVFATIAGLVVCLRVRAPWIIRIAAVITIAAGALDGFAYLFVYTAGPLGLVPESAATRTLINTSLPLFQRIATITTLVWVLAMCAHTLRLRSAPPER